MNEEEFLKEHPSFKGKPCLRQGMVRNTLPIFASEIIHSTQLDKQKVISLTTNQIHDLIVKGECQAELKITALFEGKLFENNLMKRLNQEHIILEYYKQKVKEALDSIAMPDTVRVQIKNKLGID